MLDDIKTLIWFILRPNFYSALWDLILRNLILKNKDDNFSKKLAKDWCESNSVSKDILFEEIGIKSVISFKDVAGESYFDEINRKIEASISNFGGCGDLDLIYNLSIYFKLKNVIETGVAYGWSASAILHGISDDDGLLVSVDMPMPKQEDYQMIGVAVKEKHLKNWFLIREPDKYGLLKAFKKFNRKVDMVHYDSDKNYYGRLWAYPKIMKNLAKGGFLICDDIEDNLHFKDFTSMNDYPYWVTFVDGKYVGIIKNS
tara:strand:+ start:5624 stop:6397 length:774 start_codon:yes stop_codon:yes gene_type:complete